MIVSARREDRLKELVDELPPGDHWYVICDVTDLDSVRRMAAVVAERTDHLDLLFNNAGRPGAGLMAKATSEDIEAVVRTNLLGSMWCTRELLELIGAAPRTGRLPAIVNMASMAGRIALPGAATYTATKFGMVGFSEALWSEMSQRGVQVMVICPGLVHTEGFPMDRILSKPWLRWSVMGPDRVAEAMIRGVERRRAEVRVQSWWSAVYYLLLVLGAVRRFLVRLFLRLVNKVVTTNRD